MVADSEKTDGGPGVLYYDPTPTSAKLATATLRLAGYRVFFASSRRTAVEQCRVHGPGGDRSIVTLLLDASADAAESAAVLGELARVPGAADLPGILLVSRRNPQPIPGGHGLPRLRRPFSGPALVKAVREAIESVGSETAPSKDRIRTPEGRLRDILNEHLPRGAVTDALVQALYRALDEDQDLPALKADCHLFSSLRTTPLEALIDMIAQQGVRGIITVAAEDEREGRLHIDRGNLHLAEYYGDDEDLKIGRFVVDGGFMAAAQIDAFAAAHGSEGLPLGKRLLNAGKLDARQLSTVLRAQSREIACHLLTWTDGLVSFRPTKRLHPLALAAMDDGAAPLPLSELLLEGLRRIDERAAMGQHMPQGDDIYLRNDEQLLRVGKDHLDRSELTVLEQLNGRTSVRELARRSKMGSFAVARIVYRLAKARLVRKRIPPVASP